MRGSIFGRVSHDKATGLGGDQVIAILAGEMQEISARLIRAEVAFIQAGGGLAEGQGLLVQAGIDQAEVDL